MNAHKLIAAVATAVALLGGVALATPAHADFEDWPVSNHRAFLADIHERTTVSYDVADEGSILLAGMLTCGETPQQAMKIVVNGNGYDADVAEIIIDSAARYLCDKPSYPVN